MSKYFQTIFSQKTLRRFGPPLLILLVMLLAYGWQIHRLGFYWDDWSFVFRYQTLGIFRTIFYPDVRQLGVLALLPGFLFSADSPLRWHVYILLLRWVGVLVMASALNRLWPGHKTSVTLMALLFSVYPAFTQQSISVVYSLQFFTYAIFFLSLTLMIAAEREKKYFWGLTFLALLAQAFHLFIVEYFVGLELIRPLVLFFLQEETSNLQKAKKALLHWLPYVLVLGTYLAWRLGLFGGGFATYDYKIFPALFRADPSGTLLDQSRYALQDMLQVVLNTWQATLQPGLIDWAQPYNFFSLGVALLAAGALIYILPRLQLDDLQATGDRFQAQAITLGLFTVIVGFIPAWFVTRHIIMPGYFGDRFALPSMFGASILLVGLAHFFGDAQRRRDVLVCSLLVGLAVGLQVRVSDDYRWDWARQSRTYWQAYWRMPSLKSGSVLVGDGALSATTNNYAGIFAFINLYSAAGKAGSPPSIWYVNYYKTLIPANLNQFLAGKMQYVDESNDIYFPVTLKNSVGIYYDVGRCLKVLDAADLMKTGEIPVEFQDVARFSNPALIQAHGQPPPARIFGPEPAPDWCTFFEKADLARQLGDWQQVIKWKKEADQRGFTPLNAYENMPFIEAYGMAGDWNHALKLSLESYKGLKKTRAALCLAWDTLAAKAPDHAGYLKARPLLDAQLGCEQPHP